MQRPVNPPPLGAPEVQLLPYACDELRRKFQWWNARLQSGKRQVRSLSGVLTRRNGGGVEPRRVCQGRKPGFLPSTTWPSGKARERAPNRDASRLGTLATPAHAGSIPAVVLWP